MSSSLPWGVYATQYGDMLGTMVSFNLSDRFRLKWAKEESCKLKVVAGHETITLYG